MKIQVCVGSSCHIKGSHEIVMLFQKYIEEYKLEEQVNLSGNFCIGKCNREGVTVQVDEAIYTGITSDNFENFFQENVLKGIEYERK